MKPHEMRFAARIATCRGSHRLRCIQNASSNLTAGRRGQSIASARGSETSVFHKVVPGTPVLSPASGARDADQAGKSDVEAFVVTPGEFFFDDLYGYEVRDSEGRRLAAVSDIRHGKESSWAMHQARPLAPEGNVASLVTGGGFAVNYFHWMYDVVPRAVLLRRAGVLLGDEIFLTAKIDKQFQIDALGAAGIEEASILSVDGIIRLNCSRLAATTGHRQSVLQPWLVDIVRELFPPRLATTRGRRIYLRRGDAPSRRVLNEHLLVSVLERWGFEAISLADLFIADQVAIFGEAEWVIAAHGAGLTNVTFCAPETTVTELVGEWDGLMFRDIAAHVGLCYERHCVLRTAGSRILPPRHRDVIVDIAQLETHLRATVARFGLA